MDREQFYRRLADMDEKQLKKALWTLYWRGGASVRERIEAEVAPEQLEAQRAPAPQVDPRQVLAEVRQFATLARAGAYLAGDRRVSPKERTRWRFTFRRLVASAQDALRADPAEDGHAAVALLIDLACETRAYDYFRSQEPMESARFVVSDAAAELWKATRDRSGFQEFARTAAVQLCAWESKYGWTRSGSGEVSSQERSLSDVVAGMLESADAWLTFGEHYLDALDQSDSRRRRARSADLAAWNQLLRDKLVLYEADALLKRLVQHVPSARVNRR